MTDTITQNKKLPRKNQLNFMLTPWFNLFFVIFCMVSVLWLNYNDAEISGISPIKVIFGGLFSFTLGILVGMIGSKWHIKAIEEKWDEIKGWKILFLNYVLLKNTKYGKKTMYYGVLILVIPTIIFIPAIFIAIDSTSIPYKYVDILIGYYLNFIIGEISSLYCLSVYLWSRKLPE